MTRTRPTLRTIARTISVLAFGLAGLQGAHADDAAIRKAYQQLNPQGAPIDEITRTAIPGLYEVRVGSEIFYSDEKGEHVIYPADGNSQQGGTGHIIDLKAKADLTQARIDKLNAIDVDKLPFKDALVMKQGTGARRLVVFEDPNCGYCRRLERDLVSLKDVTIYTFLVAVLGPDSKTKARDIWCAKDNANVWRNWMLTSSPVRREMGMCDGKAVERNDDLAHRYRINGTPTLVFDDGARIASALPLEEIEKAMAAHAKKS